MNIICYSWIFHLLFWQRILVSVHSSPAAGLCLWRHEVSRKSRILLNSVEADESQTLQPFNPLSAWHTVLHLLCSCWPVWMLVAVDGSIHFCLVYHLWCMQSLWGQGPACDTSFPIHFYGGDNFFDILSCTTLTFFFLISLSCSLLD